jgi:predicted GH43/DUF377 family glycosyl hydrolase
MRWQKHGLIAQPDHWRPWWRTHAQAPSAILLDEQTIRVFVGAWDELFVPRIGSIDLDADDPSRVLGWSENPVLDVGRDGCFDEAGVFPAHVLKVGDWVYFYYTGFQEGQKIRHYNFGGLALSQDGGRTFRRVSEAPVLDRTDEGLFVRAGQSILIEDAVFRTVYSAGSGWTHVGGKDRPNYDVFYQESPDGVTYAKAGQRILQADTTVEHGLGRPQLVKIRGRYYIFYTRRTLDMKYHMGCAVSDDCQHWTRMDAWLGEGIPHGQPGAFDCDMVYFPCVLDTGRKTFLFYSGNYFGQGGLGYAELIFDD